MRFLTIVGLAILVSAPAVAGPVGDWRIADGTANVAIKTCGSDLCGYVSWSKESGNFVGKEVLINMKPADEKWVGTVVDIRNGTRYSARMKLENEQTLRVEGCILGGLICGGQNWSRLR